MFVSGILTPLLFAVNRSVTQVSCEKLLQGSQVMEIRINEIKKARNGQFTRGNTATEYVAQSP